MAVDEMQRLLDWQLKDGATEWEALKYLADIVGLTLRTPEQKPENWKNA